jgi:putative transposase
MGALKNLGQTIGRSTIKRILREHGIDPAPIRGKRMPWSKFIKAHLVGMDFFTVEVMTLFGLVRYHVLFAIDIGSRVVEIAGICREPDGRWMMQMARNLVDMEDGFLRGKRHMILDRDPLYTSAFRRILKEAGVNVVRLPARSPNLNAYAERFVLSIKTECLERLVPLGEWHLRQAISEYMRALPQRTEPSRAGECSDSWQSRGRSWYWRNRSTRKTRWTAQLLLPRSGVNGCDRVLVPDAIEVKEDGA